MEKLKNKQSLYTLVFFAFVIIEYYTKNPIGLNNGFYECVRESIGTVMAVLVLSHYTKDDFNANKKIYLSWIFLFAIGIIAIALWASNYFTWYPIDFITGGYFYSAAFEKVFLVNNLIYILLLVLLWGFVVGTVIMDIIRKKKFPAIDIKLFGMWVVLMLLMIILGGGFVWPFSYLIMFGCFYLTEYSQVERTAMFQGLLNGLLLGFVLLQTYALLVVPYTTPRYSGFNANPNWNSLFFAIILAVVLTKIIIHTKLNSSKRVLIGYWLLSGIVLSLEALTVGRIGYGTVFVLCCIFLFCMSYMQKKNYIVKYGLRLVLSFIISLPLTYMSVRYVPAIIPACLSSSFTESITDDDYVSFGEFTEEAVGRLKNTLLELVSNGESDAESNVKGSTNVDNGELSEKEKYYAEKLKDIASWNPEAIENAVLTLEEGGNGLLVRKTIYSHYFSNLKIVGQKAKEQGFQLTPDYWIGHAHNIYLQFGTDFGVIALVLWLVVIIKTLINCITGYMKSDSITYVAAIFFIIVPMIFGMFEYAWGNGALSITMMFVSGWYALRSKK